MFNLLPIRQVPSKSQRFYPILQNDPHPQHLIVLFTRLVIWTHCSRATLPVFNDCVICSVALRLIQVITCIGDLVAPSQAAFGRAWCARNDTTRSHLRRVAITELMLVRFDRKAQRMPSIIAWRARAANFCSRKNCVFYRNLVSF